MKIEFTIPGTPVAKGRPKFARRGKFVTTYSPAKTVNYESLVKDMATNAMGNKKPLDGAVTVKIELEIIPPISWSKKKRAQAFANIIHPTSRPDVDNYGKICLDGMNGIVFKDDSQVVSLLTIKTYSDVAQASVLVVSLAGGADDGY